MRKTCEKHVEKYPYIDSIVGSLEKNIVKF